MDEADYAAWRERKLRGLAAETAMPVISVGNPRHLTSAEQASIIGQISRRNFAFYQLDARGSREVATDSDVLMAMCRQLGLEAPIDNPAADAFGLSRIECVNKNDNVKGPATRSRYVPYSDRRLNWHTDGYYNEEPRKIRAFVLHCVRAAERGGENRLADPEMLYLRLRDEYPDLLAALCRVDALQIPGDTEPDGSGRETFTGPVFSIDPPTGTLYTRYTQRRHNIRWLDDERVREAVDRLNRMLDEPGPAVARHTLMPGQGVICNNVLHCRSGFDNAPGSDQGRLLYRLRFGQRVGEPARP